MTTATMTLTAFLTARLADDVALARQVQAQAVTDGIDPEDPRLPALGLAARVLREVEAKWTILEYHTESDYCCDTFDVDACPTFAALVAIYADHPDYPL